MADSVVSQSSGKPCRQGLQVDAEPFVPTATTAAEDLPAGHMPAEVLGSPVPEHAADFTPQGLLHCHRPPESRHNTCCGQHLNASSEGCFPRWGVQSLKPLKPSSVVGDGVGRVEGERQVVGLPFPANTALIFSTRRARTLLPQKPRNDRDAYVAGERAAMARALQMLLPSQQAIGVLSSGLQRLEARVQEEAAHSRQAHLVTADARSVIQALSHRLDYVEKIRLPSIDGRIQQAIEAPLSQEFRATLLGLQGALGAVNEKAGHSPYSLTGFAIRQLTWLGTTASLYTQKVISKADVAAIFLSRKILLDNRVAGLIEPAEVGDAGKVDESSRSSTAVVGAILFLAAVESAWQLHHRALNYVPARIQKSTAPARLGLRVLRGATWTATLILSAVNFRRGCYFVADRTISELERTLKRFPTLRPFSSPVIRNPANASSAETEPGEEAAALGDDSAATNDAPEQLRSPEQCPSMSKQRSIFDTPPPSPMV